MDTLGRAIGDDASGPDAASGPDGVAAAPALERAEFVRQWTREIITTSYVPKSRSEIEEFLDECTGKLVESLLATSFTTEAATSVGARLVEAHFTGAAAVDRSLRLLATELPKLVGSPASADALPRLVALLGAFGASFSDTLRERTLAEQEVIKQSVLRAKEAAEEARRASVARFRAVFTTSGVGIAIADLDGRLSEANLALTEITGRTGEELTEWTVFSFASEWGSEELETHEADLVAGDLDRFHVQCEFSSGDERVVTDLAVSLVRDAQAEPDYQVVLVQDVTRRYMLQQEMHRQAMHDPLTGLANRTRLRSRMQMALESGRAGHRVGLCYFDLDGFKAVNDSLGHPIGDELLRAIAQRLHALTAAEGCLTARMGGDEFVVLVPDSPGTSGVVDLVQRMLAEVTRPVRIGDHELNVSASVGVVEREVGDVDPDGLLRDADITLYRAKAEGKAQWALFDAELNEVSRRRFKLSATMPAALDEYEFFVEYLPILRLDSGALQAVEAKIFWDHPDFGQLDSGEFLPMAEETGLIVRLGNWLLEQVCEHAVRWQRSLGERAPLVGVSLSPHHFRSPDFVGDVRRILSESGMPPSGLAFALPGAALFDGEGDPIDTVDIFAEMGVRVLVDDFGAHYRQLGRLRTFANHGSIEFAKLPGGCVSNFDRLGGPDAFDEHVLGSLVGSAQLLGLTVCADGVDTKLQAERLYERGVRVAQGEYFGGIASAMEVEAMITKGEM